MIEIDPQPRRGPAWLRGLLPETKPDDLTGEAPRHAILFGLGITAAFLAVLLGWGLLARLDAAVVAQGQIVIFGNRQAVQHLDGGIVSALNVREGDQVTAGQVLLSLDAGQVSASERAVAAQVIELRAQQARLLAELQNRRTIAWPADFSAATGDDARDVAVAEALQQREFATRAAALVTGKSVLAQKEKESSEQIGGYKRQVTANVEQQRLIAEEVGGLQGLLKRGLVPATRVRSLQRNAAELAGNQGEYDASIARTQQEIGETRIRISDLDRERAADDSRDYRTAEFQLAELQPKLTALQQQVARTIVRSPASGRVVGLTIFTVGGVIAPGQKLMEIAPDNQPLVVEAKVKPSDVGDLRVGQETEIRIPAFHDRGMPKIMARLTRISADSFSDEKSGQSFFKVEVVAPPSELRLIQERRGGAPGLRPGLPVEMVVPLGRRTALAYLTEPLRQTLWHSFREH